VKLTPGASEAELDAMLRDQVVLKPVKELMKYQLVESDEDNYRWGHGWGIYFCILSN
jgi:hypothetical protein